ncbi:aminotransferase [Rhodobacteraceae bacterium 2376]|uniref:Aminotransferase n=1 Tax=Rhabdonatronobacter sediminivivens TaxID=2743469 RepID=A0A7Z0I1E7_9RHOB|nr:aminotransferase [Rhabdonatronobacter sediminivivens]NYS26133.1 aminotransferase [Rhabdonatronobacter sediminivivens]
MNLLANTPAADDLTRWDRENHLHPWAEVKSWRKADYMRVDTAEGIYLWDGAGRRFIDGPGGMWCVQIGYGRAEMARAIAEQTMKMAYTSPWTATSGPTAQLAHMIAARTPGDLNTVHFTTGGSTAVDTALRFMQFFNNRLGRPDKKVILAREKGYHGSTYLASTVTGKERFEAKFDKASDLVHFLPDVNPYRRPPGMSMAAWCDAKVADLQDAIATLGADRIGAFIAEPILCSGGVIVPPEGYHRRTFEICRAHDILYISDEVVTGFGRLGHWFASDDAFGVTPDIITMAKGMTSGYLPLGACVISDTLMARVSAPDGQDVFYNGYTYSGHPVSCAAAIANIEIMEREDILGHVRRVTPQFHSRMRRIADRFDIVGDVRGMGLLGCIECRPDLHDPTYAKDLQFGARLDAACERRGLLLRPFGAMAVFSPPLIISEAQIEEMFDIMEAGLEELSAEYNA